MQHNLIRIPRRVVRVAFAPVVRHCVRKDVSVAVEARSADASAHLRIPLEPVFGVLVPEVEGTVAAGGAEGSVLRVEGDGVDGVYFRCVPGGGVGLAVALE